MDGLANLDWFGASALAEINGAAIRREAWTYWLVFRCGVYELIAGGTDAPRVAKNTDFGEAEFLAKDWTNIPWDGGSLPPCAQNPPATKLPAGGTGAWTTTPGKCDGGGDAGNIPVVPDPTVTGAPEVVSAYGATMTPWLVDVWNTGSGGYWGGLVLGTSAAVKYRAAAVANGAGCWVSRPACGWSFDVSAPIGASGRTYAQFAPTGIDLHGSSASLTPITGAVNMTAQNLGAPDAYGVRATTGGPAAYLATVVGTTTLFGPPDSRSPYTGDFFFVTPGDTWQGRIIFTDGGGAIVHHEDISYTFAAACVSTSGGSGDTGGGGGGGGGAFLMTVTPAGPDSTMVVSTEPGPDGILGTGDDVVITAACYSPGASVTVTAHFTNTDASDGSVTITCPGYGSFTGAVAALGTYDASFSVALSAFPITLTADFSGVVTGSVSATASLTAPMCT